MENKTIIIIAIAALVLGIGGYWLFFSNVSVKEEYHVHADFAVFIDGQKIDFAKEEFMGEEVCGKPGEDEHDIDFTTIEGVKEAAHLHDLNGNVMHIHHENATLSMFFQGIGFGLTENCFKTPSESFCNSEEKNVKVLVNGVELKEFANYKPGDLDKILIFYGSGDLSFENVSNEACIYSEKCPIPAGFVLTEETCT